MHSSKFALYHVTDCDQSASNTCLPHVRHNFDANCDQNREIAVRLPNNPSKSAAFPHTFLNDTGRLRAVPTPRAFELPRRRSALERGRSRFFEPLEN